MCQQTSQAASLKREHGVCGAVLQIRVQYSRESDQYVYGFSEADTLARRVSHSATGFPVRVEVLVQIAGIQGY